MFFVEGSECGELVFLEKFRVCGLGGLGEVMHGWMVMVEVGDHVEELCFVALDGESVDLLVQIFDSTRPNQMTASFCTDLDGMRDNP